MVVSLYKQLFFLLILLCINYSSQRRNIKRRLQSIDDPYDKQVYIIAGNFSLDGEMMNFAQYDVYSDRWVKKYQAELSTVESHGVILDVVSNHSNSPFSDKLYVVGTFDTMTSTSQMQFCSVGCWNGISFEKVGEGLCPRGNVASAMTTKILAITLGSDGDLFVGGSFESRMWDGKKFINIQHLARFYGPTSSWLPLSEGSLTNHQAAHSPSVRALSWNRYNGELYIGGDFDSLEGAPLSVGLAIWREDLGLISFPTKGVYIDDLHQSGGSIDNVNFEEISKSLFVSGNFRWIGGMFCPNLAVWHRASNNWTCLYESNRAISTITALLLDGKYLYSAGWASPSSDWNGRQWNANYAIAVLNIAGYIKEKSQQTTNQSLPIYGNQTLIDHKNGSTLSALGKYRRKSFRRSSALYPLHTSAPTKSPTHSTYIPWTPSWHWLDGYAGANGPIVKLVPGNYDLLGCLFIVGAFNNYQAVLLWCNDTINGPTITSISPNHTIQGLITSIIQLSISVEFVPTLAPVLPPSPGVVVIDRSHAVLLLFSFAVLLVAVVSLVLIRNRQGYSQLSTEDEPGQRKKDGDDLMFPLTTLSGNIDNSVDFRASFERAMQARHLPSHESLLIIDPREVILKKSIGEGSFGRVWSGYWRNNAVAIKEFVFAQAAIVGGSVDRNNIIDEIVGEAGIMACLRHPKILQIYGCSLTMQAIWIASELCNRGSLRMVLNDKSAELTLLKKLSLCVDVADGMLYLHTRNPPIIHRDLKSHNIFVIETLPGHFIAKIGDWGSARALALSGAKSMTQGVGTACWLAPEVINNAHFSKESDIYAFGILLWEVYTRQEVHDRLSAAQIIAKVAHEGLRPPIPINCPWADLMSACWRQNNRLRPGFNKILTDLSALYSEEKANVRLQHMVETKQLTVNPDVVAAGQDNRPNRTRSSPGFLVCTAPVQNEDADMTTANSKINFDGQVSKHANSTPLSVLSSTNTPITGKRAENTSRVVGTPKILASNLESQGDNLKISNDVIGEEESVKMEEEVTNIVIERSIRIESNPSSRNVEEDVTEEALSGYNSEHSGRVQTFPPRSPRRVVGSSFASLEVESIRSSGKFSEESTRERSQHRLVEVTEPDYSDINSISPDAGGYDTT